MSFWYGNQEDIPNKNSVWDGKPLTWHERMENWWGDITRSSSGFSSRKNSGFFDIAIDMPARFIGGQIGLLLGVAFFALSIFVGFKAGEWVTKRYGKAAGWVVGLIVGIYLGMILYRSQHWAAFALLERGRS